MVLYGFSNWQMLGVELDEENIVSAPHNYLLFYGN